MKLGCDFCKGEPEPGWIETTDNGPIVPCPICNNPDSDRICDAVEAERELSN